MQEAKDGRILIFRRGDNYQGLHLRGRQKYYINRLSREKCINKITATNSINALTDLKETRECNNNNNNNNNNNKKENSLYSE
jgi:hypothetical protein